MPRFSPSSWILGTLSAAAAVCLSFAASAAPAVLSALIMDPRAHCGGKTPLGTGDPQGLRDVCEVQAAEEDWSYLLEEMFNVGKSVIDSPPTIGVALVAERQKDAKAIRPAVVRVARISPSERARRGHFHEARNGGRRAPVRARHTDKKTLIAALDMRHLEKAHRKTAAEARVHEPHRTVREGHRELPRRCSHLA